MRKYPIFKDSNGNRFIFPGFYTDQDRTARWMQARYICMVLDVTEEIEKFCIEPDMNGVLQFPHLETQAGSSGFAHGSETIWIIGGPEFDSAMESVDG